MFDYELSIGESATHCDASSEKENDQTKQLDNSTNDFFDWFDSDRFINDIIDNMLDHSYVSNEYPNIAPSVLSETGKEIFLLK